MIAPLPIRCQGKNHKVLWWVSGPTQYVGTNRPKCLSVKDVRGASRPADWNPGGRREGSKLARGSAMLPAVTRIGARASFAARALLRGRRAASIRSASPGGRLRRWTPESAGPWPAASKPTTMRRRTYRSGCSVRPTRPVSGPRPTVWRRARRSRACPRSAQRTRTDPAPDAVMAGAGAAAVL